MERTEKGYKRLAYVRNLAETQPKNIERLGGYLDGLYVSEKTKLKLHNLFFSIVDKQVGASSPSE